MMNIRKIIKITLNTCLFIFITSAVLADPSDNHAALIKKYQDAINQSYNEHQTERNNQIAQAQQQAQDQAENTAKTDDSSDNSTPSAPPSVKTKKTQAISCDCYDTSSSYNYPANFYYNSKHIRVKRIQPACLCEKHDPEKSDQTNSNQNTMTTSSNMNMDALADSSASSSSNGSDASNSNNTNSNSNNQQNNNDNFGITYN